MTSKTHCGRALVEAVHQALSDEPLTSSQVNARMGGQMAGFYTDRAIRYALSELIIQRRAQRTSYRGRVCLPNKGV